MDPFKCQRQHQQEVYYQAESESDHESETETTGASYVPIPDEELPTLVTNSRALSPLSITKGDLDYILDRIDYIPTYEMELFVYLSDTLCRYNEERLWEHHLPPGGRYMITLALMRRHVDVHLVSHAFSPAHARALFEYIAADLVDKEVLHFVFGPGNVLQLCVHHSGMCVCVSSYTQPGRGILICLRPNEEAGPIVRTTLPDHEECDIILHSLLEAYCGHGIEPKH